LFTKATLHLENGKDFVISAPNKTPERIHVKNVKLNGKPIKDYTLTHQQIMAGGNLEFILK
jgi:putative alpha-1,2-mannosidase